MTRVNKVGPVLCAVFCLSFQCFVLQNPWPASALEQNKNSDHSEKQDTLGKDKDGHDKLAQKSIGQNQDDSISLDYARAIARKVNETVTKDFFDATVAEGPWRTAYERLEQTLKNDKTAPKTLIALDTRINEALQSLKTSHCQFATLNDESFFFLHSLFGTINARFRTGPHAWARPIPCTGFATGGCGFDNNQVRYVLDGSPAAQAGLAIGDHLKQVDGRPYTGYLNFLGTAGKQLKLLIDRAGTGETGHETGHEAGHEAGHEKELLLTPVKKDLYTLYVEATKASKKTIKQGKYTLGYVHLWAGGSATAEAVNDILTTDFKDVDGLIYDLRDGYGGASFEDMDLFYRPRSGFPDCMGKDRSGKVTTDRMYFDKPVVVLINAGARSGKELLAYSFKNSGRAKLVGENTAGAVVAGRLYPLDGKCALYLAIVDISLQGKQKERLEGVGVAPDIVVLNNNHDQVGYGLQLSTAIEALEKQLASQN
jgi:carboxyl-terminal processing protease